MVLYNLITISSIGGHKVEFYFTKQPDLRARSDLTTEQLGFLKHKAFHSWITSVALFTFSPFMLLFYFYQPHTATVSSQHISPERCIKELKSLFRELGLVLLEDRS